MKRIVTLGYSPCPNDTFIFHALVHGRVPLGEIEIRERLEDVETLNRLALDGVLDLTKISYHAFGHLRSDYALLRSGSALGRGCGPLVVARRPLAMAELRGRRIAVPGLLTTANLLLQLRGSGYENLLVLPFDRVMEAVSSGEAEAGLVIHEGRFTYQGHGLQLVEDLGVWWEGETGLPLPLGGILAKRSLGREVVQLIDQALSQSLRQALAAPTAAADYIRSHAQELDERVIASHIGLYVNDFSLDLGDEGERAVRELLRRAEARGIVPATELPLFV